MFKTLTNLPTRLNTWQHVNIKSLSCKYETHNKCLRTSSTFTHLGGARSCIECAERCCSTTLQESPRKAYAHYIYMYIYIYIYNTYTNICILRLTEYDKFALSNYKMRQRPRRRRMRRRSRNNRRQMNTRRLGRRRRRRGEEETKRRTRRQIRKRTTFIRRHIRINDTQMMTKTKIKVKTDKNKKQKKTNTQMKTKKKNTIKKTSKKKKKHKKKP